MRIREAKKRFYEGLRQQSRRLCDSNMGVIMKRNIFVLFAVFVTVFLSACYEPSPLYGTWADNDGNSISFIVDGTFNAKIKVEDKIETYQGDYDVIDNVITFSYTDSAGKAGKMNSEWDIRGSMMYIRWTVEGSTRLLTLYHTSK